MSMEDFEEDREVLMLDALYSVMLITVILWSLNLYILTFIYLATICSMLLGTEEEEDIADFRYASWGEEEKEEYIENEIWNFDDPEHSYTERILTEMLGYDFMAYDLINLMEVRAISPQQEKTWAEISSAMNKLHKTKENQFILDLIAKRGLKSMTLENILEIVDNSNMKSELNEDLPMNTNYLIGKRIILEKALEVAKSNDPLFWKYGNVKAVRKIMAYRYHADQLRDAWIRSGLYTASDLDYNIFKHQVLHQFNPIRDHNELTKLNCNYLDDFKFDWWKEEQLRIGNCLSSVELDIYLKYRIHLIQASYFKKQAMGRAGVAKDMVTGWCYPREIYYVDISRWWDFELELFQDLHTVDKRKLERLAELYYRSVIYPMIRRGER